MTDRDKQLRGIVEYQVLKYGNDFAENQRIADTDINAATDAIMQAVQAYADERVVEELKALQITVDRNETPLDQHLYLQVGSRISELTNKDGAR